MKKHHANADLADFGRHKSSDVTKCVVQNVTQLLLLHHLQFVMYDHSKTAFIISLRHLTKGTGALEAGLILQRSFRDIGVAIVG